LTALVRLVECQEKRGVRLQSNIEETGSQLLPVFLLAPELGKVGSTEFAGQRGLFVVPVVEPASFAGKVEEIAGVTISPSNTELVLELNGSAGGTIASTASSTGRLRLSGLGRGLLGGSGLGRFVGGGSRSGRSRRGRSGLALLGRRAFLDECVLSKVGVLAPATELSGAPLEGERWLSSESRKEGCEGDEGEKVEDASCSHY